MRNDFPQCVEVLDGEEVVRRVRLTQASMIQSVQDCFSESEIDHLRCVVRLTIEFHYYLQLACGHSYCSEYVSESIFAGIDSYQSLTHGYNVLVGAMESQLEWRALSLPSLKENFAASFDQFDKEEIFEKKCRHLLDSFKLQIVFAGIAYG
ncbi:MAG: hypothetical protein WBE86_13465 [Candidatus Acidiferrales bacterium]